MTAFEWRFSIFCKFYADPVMGVIETMKSGLASPADLTIGVGIPGGRDLGR